MAHVAADLYETIGGTTACHQLARALYARLSRDPLLRHLFPGKSTRCAEDAFAAFLAQFLGGPAENAEKRWWLSLRESHARFSIGPREREAWITSMMHALDEVPLAEPVRRSLRDFFEHSSRYIASGTEAPDNPLSCEYATRWEQQRALDDLVAALNRNDASRALELAQSPVLAARFAQDPAVFAHVLSLMMAAGLTEYVERELLAQPDLARVHHRYGRTLLHDAAAQGNLRIVELLLRLGADPNATNSGGHAPLYCLANECGARGVGSVVGALISAGAQVDACRNVKRCTALHMAARRGNLEIAEALLDCGADIHARDKTGDTPLRRARNCRKPTLAALLESRGAFA